MATNEFPAEFGRYRLTGSLGAGGMAEVYRAETQPVAGISRQVAIKRLRYGLREDPTLANMLLDEARIWVRLQHPNIVNVIEFGEHDGDFFLALELVEGVTAAELLRDDGPLPVREALAITERVARALSYAHTLEENGQPLCIVHRDVKPANVLLSKRGEVKLTDFGIARATDRVTRTQVGMIKGSLPYLAPEQVREEKIDARTDLFALGCMLHALLTGKPLIEKSREGIMLALSRGEIPPPPADLPGPVRILLRALTAADPAQRPHSAADVAKQIRALLAPESAEDLEEQIAARVVDALARVDTVKAIRAQRDESGAPVGEVRPAAAIPGAARNAVVPKHDATDHPSWREPDLAALPPDEGLDDPNRLKKRPGPERPPARSDARAPARETDTTAPAPAAPRRAQKNPAPVLRPLETTAAAGAVEPRQKPAPGTTGISRVFEIAPRFTEKTGAAIRAAPLKWKIAVAALGGSLLLLAAVIVPPTLRRMQAVGCSSLKAGLAGAIQERGFDATPELVESLDLRCRGDAEALRLRTRLLALSGNTRATLASLPPPSQRTVPQKIVAASLELSNGDLRGAEEDARLIANDGHGDAPLARCLAAAAAIDQDHPERVEQYLANANDDCAHILRAAAAIQVGNRSAALTQLSRPPADSRYDAAWESALGVIHLLSNDMESAAADAKTADDRANTNALAEHPFVWYTMPSPTGSASIVLRLTGPTDDAVLYTHVLLGDAARVRGNLELALKFYDEAGNRGGRAALADLRAASVYVKQGKPPLARARLNRAIQIAPTFGPALVALALLEEQDSDPKIQQLAVQHAIAALATQPENHDARRIASRGR